MKPSTTRHSDNRTDASGKLWRLLAVLFWVGVWLMAALAVDQPIILPTPMAAVIKLYELMCTAPFYRAVLNSFGRILIGFALAVSIGTALAICAFWSRSVRTLLQPPMSAIGATPIASFSILALVMIGKNNLSICISFLMALPVMYYNVLEGLGSTDRKLLEMARVFGVRRGKVALRIYAPGTLPYFLSACQIALGMCWKSGLAAEVIGQPNFSIGDMLYRAKNFIETDTIFAWTIAIILLSVCLERLVIVVIRRVNAVLEGGGEQ